MRRLMRLVGLDATTLARRVRRTAFAAGLAVAAGLTAVGFLGVAAHAALMQWLTPIHAALVVATCAALIAAVSLAWAGRDVDRARRDVARAVRSSALVAMVPPLGGVARRHAGVVGLAAAIGAGFWLARSLAGGRGPGESPDA